MKNYNEVVDSLFQRRDEYCDARKKKMKNFRQVAFGFACVCFTTLLIIGVLKDGVFDSNQNNETGKSGFSDKMKSSNNPISLPEVTVLNQTIKMYPEFEPSYQAPNAGEYFCHMEVMEARKHHIDADVCFLLAMNIFTYEGEETNLSGDELYLEYQRMIDNGYALYESSYWEYQGSDGQKVEIPIIVGRFTESQLQDFNVNPKYGYAFYFKTNGDGSAVEFEDSKLIKSVESLDSLNLQ